MKKEDYLLSAPLNNEENIRLIREYKKTNSPEIKNKIIEGNLRFVYQYMTAHSKNIVERESQCYPTLNDLVQDGVFTLYRVIDKFDPEQNIKFSTYLSTALFNMLGMQARRKVVKPTSLDNPTNEDENLTVKDLIADGHHVPTEMLVENREFLKDVLNCLQYHERQLYIDKVFHNMTQYEMAEKYNITQSYVCRVLNKVFKRINHFRQTGITDLDVEMGGVNLNKTAWQAYKESHQIVKKNGLEFLRDCYLPTLSSQQADLFEECVLYYAGQPFSEFCPQFGKKGSVVRQNREKIIKNLDENVENLKSELKDGRIFVREIPKKFKDRIFETQNFVKNFGGRVFLTKNFLPTLNEDEKLSFKYGILNYGGQTLKELCQKTNIKTNDFNQCMNSAIKKLQTTNFFECTK